MEAGESTGQETNKRGILFCCGTVVALRARRNSQGAFIPALATPRQSPVDARMGFFPNLFIYLYYDDQTPKATPYTYQCGSDRFAPPGPQALVLPAPE